MRKKHTHILSLKNNTHNLGYSLNSLGQSLMNPLKTPSELKRPETSILITAPLSITFAAPVLVITGHGCLELDMTMMNNPTSPHTSTTKYFVIGLQLLFLICDRNKVVNAF